MDKTFATQKIFKPGPSDQLPSMELQERLFHDALWSAFLTALRAYGKRYGYCVDIKVIKE